MSHSALKAKHFNGTAPTAGEKISAGTLIHKVVIRNLDSANSLGISFDAGRTYFTLPFGQELSTDIHAHFLWLRGEGGDADYTLMLLG